jgi:arylsulfatase A
MNHTTFSFVTRAITALLLLAVSVSAAERTNFIVMLIDDLGATDLGCQGSKFYETPHIDQLAADGMRFTNAYSACTVCSPTRAALLTGKYPARLCITDWIAGHQRPKAKLAIPDWVKELPRSETTLAEHLKSAGYATATIGKWHLGDAAPTEHGFDLNAGGYNRGQPPKWFAPYKIPTLTDGPDGEFLTERLTAEAEKFIEANRGRPFFVYLPHYTVHTPLDAKPEVIAKYKAKAEKMQPQGNIKYAAMIESMDDSVGRLRAKLRALGLDGNTVFIFTSDNGGLRPVTLNLGLRAGKGSAYEGGVRIPLIVHWPGVTKPGTTSDTPTITMDIFATLTAATGAKDTHDGADLRPLLRGEKLPPRPIYWHYPHYHPGGATPYSAVRDGDWRLVHFFEDDHAELYNLRDDPEEKTDLTAKEPGKTKTLRAQLDAWRKQVGAQLPTPNPKHEPEKDAAKERP